MGVSCYKEKKRLKTLNFNITQEKNLLTEKIKKLESDNHKNDKQLKEKKDIIIKKIEKEKICEINKEVDEYYNLLNEQTNITKTLNNLRNQGNCLDNLLFQMKNKSSNKEKIEYIQSTYERIQNEIKKTYTIEKDFYLENKNQIKNFGNLKFIIMTEIKGIKKRKKDFKTKLNKKKNNNLIYPESIVNSINNNLNNLDISYNKFENNLNSYFNQINEEIKNILNNNNNILTSYSASSYDVLYNAIHRDIVSMSINESRILLNEIYGIKNFFEKNLQKRQNLISLINKNETNINNKESYVGVNIYNKERQLNILRKCRDDLKLDSKNYIEKLNKIINAFTDIEYKNTNNYLYYNIFNEIINDINNLNIIMLDEIKNSKNMSKLDSEISKMKSEVEKLINIPEYVLIDSFDQRNNNKDQSYIKFKKKEEIILKESFIMNKQCIENIFIDDINIKSIPSIDIDIIKNIFINENSENYCKNKIIKEIEIITNDDEKYKINNLNILVVGRNGIGKTTLIKYMLDLDENEGDVEGNNDFKTYTSEKVEYLKLIKVKGFGYDAGSTPNETFEKIKNYVNITNNYNNNSNQDYDNVSHCIWFCITGRRIEPPEKELLQLLGEIYKENTMPLIIVNTKSIESYEEEKAIINMKNGLQGDKIDNSFLEIIAKDILLSDQKTIRKAFGKENLMKITLMKCSNALQSDMMKIMLQKLSDDIVKNLIGKNKEISELIKYKTCTDFKLYYKEILQEGDFILYIIDIYFKYLNDFYDKNKKISNKSKNLILNSGFFARIFKVDFITSIHNIYSSYKEQIKEKIKPIAEEKAKELIDLQATMEKENGNMEIYNKRTYKEFLIKCEIFLKKNYYFLVQNYIIYFIIEKSDIYLKKFLNSFSDEFNERIKLLGNINNYSDKKYHNKVKECLEYCYKTKLNSFYKNNVINNIYLKDLDSVKELPINKINFAKYIISNNIKFNDEHLENRFPNSDSFLIDNNNIDKYNFIKEAKLKNNWCYLENYKNFLKENCILKLENFMKATYIQNSCFNLNDYDDFQNEIKKYLITILFDNISNYFSDIYYNYNNNIKKLNKANNNENFYEQNKINQIILNENFESIYKNLFYDSLEKFSKEANKIKLQYLSIVICGKSGVGKSTLINCLLKEKLAKVGDYNICTLETEVYSNKIIKFLHLVDTRGYELDKQGKNFNTDNIKTEVFDIIKNQEKKNDFNELIHCIWFCVNGSTLDKKELDLIKDLKNNDYKIPLVIVFTRAVISDDIKKMKDLIKRHFPEKIFIHVLGEGTKSLKNFGLDDLLNLTLEQIKSKKDSNLYDIIKKEYEKILKNDLNQKISNIKNNIFDKLVEEFCANYTIILKEKDFEEYVFNITENIIKKYLFKNEINFNTKKLIRNINVKNFIQSYIKFYSDKTKDYINNIIDTVSLKFLDMQVKFEKMKGISIQIRNKRNREDFKELINSFLMSNFYYVAQRYLIYRFMKDIFEDLSQKLVSNILEKITNILLNNDININYRNIYLKTLDDFSKIMDGYRNKDNKIYY